ncbi:MAG TPA: host attachment protein, partial [Thermoleophilia bacterium]|nr:host attachment protein [Thermoleophilia bacterium]
MSRIRIVVADQAEAIFYDAPSLDARPKEVGRISDPAAHLHDRDLASDRPGRSYESVGHARHAIERENDPRWQEAVRFARRISCRLDDALQKGEFEELIVVAGPPFL